MSLPTSVEVTAPAKFNPLLDVLARRDDGFHEVDTTLLAVELADHLVLRRVEGPPGGVQLSLDGPFATADVPTDGRNLVVRAAEAVLARAAPSASIAVELTKDVPSQAGLGGGSSDAAAALLGVEALLGVDLGPATRAGILAELGSDCVFFGATTGAARATGRGERLELHGAPQGTEGEWWVALLTPEERCPTGAVYGALDLPDVCSLSGAGSIPSVQAFLELRPSEARGSLHNQLEAAAFAVSPGLQRWRDALDAAGADHYRLSGSGSSFFGLYETAYDAVEGLLRVLAEGRRRELAWRGRWVTRTCGHGAKLVRV